MPADSGRHLHQIVPPTVQPTVIPVKELPQAYPQSISSLHFQAQDFSQSQVSGTAKTQPDFGFKTSQKKIRGVEDYTHWTLSTTLKQIDSPPSSLRPNDLKVPHVYSHLINLSEGTDHQVWLLKDNDHDETWLDITEDYKSKKGVPHPVIKGRWLKIGVTGNVSWVLQKPKVDI